jgi:hypothetical protein
MSVLPTNTNSELFTLTIFSCEETGNEQQTALALANEQ